MQHAASAYARTSQMALPPREVEAAVLLRAATRFQGICDDWDSKSADLGGALEYNRKLWTLLVTSATADDHPLPAEVKQGIGRLAAFIFKHTFAVLSAPEAGKLAVLININRQIAAGLRTSPQPA